MIDKENIIEKFVVDNPDLISVVPQILSALKVISDGFRKEGKLLICGNGGSASDAMHIVGELQKSFNRCRPLNGSLKEKLLQFEDGEQLISKLAIGLPAISLVNESSLMTAIANDVDATICFAQQVLALGKPNDVLLCISTSGNSRNVVLAAEVAKCIGAKIVSLIGINSRAKLRDYSDVVISVPYSETYRIQEKHLPIYHLLCNLLEEEFFKK